MKAGRKNLLRHPFLVFSLLFHDSVHYTLQLCLYQNILSTVDTSKSFIILSTLVFLLLFRPHRAGHRAGIVCSLVIIISLDLKLTSSHQHHIYSHLDIGRGAPNGDESRAGLAGWFTDAHFAAKDFLQGLDVGTSWSQQGASTLLRELNNTEANRSDVTDGCTHTW